LNVKKTVAGKKIFTIEKPHRDVSTPGDVAISCRDAPVGHLGFACINTTPVKTRATPP
jgi:hypothetical protein